MTKTPTKAKAKAKPAAKAPVKAAKPASLPKMRRVLAGMDRSIAALREARIALLDEINRLTP